MIDVHCSQARTNVVSGSGLERAGHEPADREPINEFGEKCHFCANIVSVTMILFNVC